MRSLDDYRTLARAEIAGMRDGDQRDLEAFMLVIGFCDSLGQLILFETTERILGFVGWIRGNLEHLPLFKARQFDAIRALPRQVLTGGSVLFIAETLTLEPGLSGRAARELSRLPGVERICAFVDGGDPPTRRFRERRIRHKRGLH